MIRLIGFGFALGVVGLLGSCSPQVRGNDDGSVEPGPLTEAQPGRDLLKEYVPETPEETAAIKSYFRYNRAALQWLADHQNVNGYWSAKDYAKDSIRTKREKPATVTHSVDFRDDMAAMYGSADHDTGVPSADLGVTGLALLAFVGDGHSHKHGFHANTVARAARFILGTQDAEGCFGARDDETFVYNHAVCALAICDLYELSMSPTLKVRAHKAVEFIIRCKNPGMGWRYGVQPKENDTSVTTWMVMALRAAKNAGLPFETAVGFGGANAWYDIATKVDADGVERVGYDRPGGGNARLSMTTKYHDNPGMDACAMTGRLFTGNREPKDERLIAQSKLLLKHPPTWYIDDDESKGPWKIDMHYWYFASLALYQMGGEFFRPWAKAMQIPTLLKYQRGWHPKDIARFGEGVKQGAFDAKSGEENPDAGRWLLDEHGSWDPVDVWGSVGGRVYSTAICELTISTFYRYNLAPEKPSDKTIE